jgi:quinol monooxygenase YgiN
MKIAFGVVPGLLMLALGFAQGAIAADAAGAAYVVTYIETLPAAADKAAALIRQFGAASRKHAGSVRFEVLRRIDRADEFAILEVWEDQPAHAAHASSEQTTAFRERLRPLLRAPYDERPHIVLAVDTRPAGAGVKGAIYAVTHVDVVGKAQVEGAAAVKEFSEASRGDQGNLRFDALTQTSRPNHMTVAEVWKDRKAIDAHGVAAHTTRFREKLLPLAGALYDERLYRSADR